MDSSPSNISSFIHSIELCVLHYCVTDTTVFYYQKNKYIKFYNNEFTLKNGQARTHLRIVIPSLQNIKVKNFKDLVKYLEEKFNNVPDEYDRRNLLDALRRGQVRIIEIHIYKSINRSDSLIDEFVEIKKSFPALEVLIPHCNNIYEDNDNSLYLNFLNMKRIIIYDELSKRNNDTIKLELRISYSLNLHKAFGITDDDLLRNNKWDQLNTNNLIPYYNRFVIKLIRSISLDPKPGHNNRSRNSIIKLRNLLGFEDAEKSDALTFVSETVHKINRMMYFSDNPLLDRVVEEKRKDNIHRAIRRLHLTDRKIKAWIKKNHPDLFVKVFEDEVYNFFCYEQHISFIVSFVDIKSSLNFLDESYEIGPPLKRYTMMSSKVDVSKLTDDEKKLLKKKTHEEILNVNKRVGYRNRADIIRKQHRKKNKGYYHLFEYFDPLYFNKERLKKHARIVIGSDRKGRNNTDRIAEFLQKFIIV